jgi:hypothetical protein
VRKIRLSGDGWILCRATITRYRELQARAALRALCKYRRAHRANHFSRHGYSISHNCSKSTTCRAERTTTAAVAAARLRTRVLHAFYARKTNSERARMNANAFIIAAIPASSPHATRWRRDAGKCRFSWRPRAYRVAIRVAPLGRCRFVGFSLHRLEATKRSRCNVQRSTFWKTERKRKGRGEERKRRARKRATR